MSGTARVVSLATVQSWGGRIPFLRCIVALVAVASVAVGVSHTATSAAPVCASVDSDPDGDGWGWENNASCQVQPEQAQQADTQTQAGQTDDNKQVAGSSQNQADDSDQASIPATNKTCTSADADPDGDGWGWENGQSCQMPVHAIDVSEQGPNPSQSTPQSDADQGAELLAQAILEATQSGGSSDQGQSATPGGKPTRPIIVPPPIVGPPPAVVLPAAFSQTCSSIESFMAGCNISTKRTAAFDSFGTSTGIAPSGVDVGARVQLVSGSAGVPSTNNVLYVVGPFLPTEGEHDDHDTIVSELTAVQRDAPMLSNLRSQLANVPMVYIGFGDLPDSHLPVSSRVDVTKKVVKSFEAIRTARGERDRSMLVGLSLGGVAGKIALHELEAEGFDHQIDTYMSVDAPHAGAYVPHSLQYTPIFLEGSMAWFDDQAWGTLSNSIERRLERVVELTLRSPVSQDLLVANLGYSSQKSPNIDYIKSRYTKLPSSTYNVAVVSGSITGQPEPRNPDILDVHTGKTGSSDLRSRVYFTASLADPTAAESRTFFGESSFKTFDRWRYKRSFTSTAYWGRSFDYNACSHDDGMVEEFADELRSVFADRWDNPRVTTNSGTNCFVPSASAMIGPTWVFSAATAGDTPFDQIIGDSENKEHLQTSASMDRTITTVANETFFGRQVDSNVVGFVGTATSRKVGVPKQASSFSAPGIPGSAFMSDESVTDVGIAPITPAELAALDLDDEDDD